MEVRAGSELLARGLFVALMLLFVVMFPVLWILLTIVRIVRTLALLRLLILLTVFVLGFALLILRHPGLRLVDTVEGGTSQRLMA